MRWILATLVGLSAMAVTAHPLAAALVVNGYTPATAGKYDRFANDGAFIGSAYDWSGVGRTTSGRWGVLISPSFVLSAYHHMPSVDEEIRFYASNDPSGSYATNTILSRVRLTGTDLSLASDLALIQLGEATTGAATYAIGNPATNLIGRELYVWGQANNSNKYLNVRLGRNEVTEVLPNFFASQSLGQGDVFTYDYDTSAAGLGGDEALLTTGDSGGPSFTIGADGLPELVGIHWFTYPDSGPPQGSGDTLVTSFINQLNSAMAATGSSERVTVAVVPEPNSLGLVLAGLSVVLIRRRQRAA